MPFLAPGALPLLDGAHLGATVCSTKVGGLGGTVPTRHAGFPG